ncbi:MAG: efflux RND transporter periplasmic adaptor subunit [Lentisphaeria bacterium]|jgi:membrane fusion protein (multidrug efflux system)
MRIQAKTQQLLGAGLLGAGLLLAGCGQAKGPKAGAGGAAPPPPEVGVVAIQPERLVLTVELPGRTAPFRIAEIRPQVNGLILRRAFAEGADVQAGELLYQIDPAPYQAAHDQAQAAVMLAEANLPAARAREARFKELAASRAVGQQDYDDALAALRQAEAQLAVNTAALAIAKVNLSYTPIKAPISGRVGRSSVTEGALVAAYQPLPLATIQQLDPIYVDVPQSTTELLQLRRRLATGRLSPDGAEQAKVTILQEDGTAYPLAGTLQFRDVSVEPSTGSVILRVVVPNPEGTLLPGMFVRAVLKEGVKEDALLLPQPAVERTPKGEPFALVVDAAGKTGLRMLTLDRAIGDRWLVAAGLAPGDRVVVEGLQNVRPGVAVKAVPAGAAASQPPATAKPK